MSVSERRFEEETSGIEWSELADLLEDEFGVSHRTASEMASRAIGEVADE